MVKLGAVRDELSEAMDEMSKVKRCDEMRRLSIAQQRSGMDSCGLVLPGAVDVWPRMAQSRLS